jgi:hypothetical protein
MHTNNILADLINFIKTSELDNAKKLVDSIEDAPKRRDAWPSYGIIVDEPDEIPPLETEDLDKE